MAPRSSFGRDTPSSPDRQTQNEASDLGDDVIAGSRRCALRMRVMAHVLWKAEITWSEGQPETLVTGVGGRATSSSNNVVM